MSCIDTKSLTAFRACWKSTNKAWKINYRIWKSILVEKSSVVHIPEPRQKVSGLFAKWWDTSSTSVWWNFASNYDHLNVASVRHFWVDLRPPLFWIAVEKLLPWLAFKYLCGNMNHYFRLFGVIVAWNIENTWSCGQACNMNGQTNLQRFFKGMKDCQF